MLMTQERDSVHAKDVSPGRQPATVRTGEAARLLGPAAARLGLRMDRQEIRRLCDQGRLQWEQFTAGGWRLVSVASINELIRDYNERADRAEHPNLAKHSDSA